MSEPAHSEPPITSALVPDLERVRRFVLDRIAEGAFAALSARPFDAVLVMSHSFDLDLEHLRRWLPSRAPYVGLLGPASRRDELLRELGGAAEKTRLHAPIGLPLGGHGAEAIALAITAELQQRFAREE